jgi:hypothetical protein
MVKEITSATFADQINRIFRIHCSGEPLELELTEVAVRPASRVGGLRQPFTLIFEGPRNRLLAEGLYPVEGEAVGTLELYVIPILSVGERQAYQVVFN